MKIFLICSVRGAPPEVLQNQWLYVCALESWGHRVHYPPRDTNQTASGLEICRQNADAISEADEVHIFYRPDSQGTHFDMGVTFALGKRIKVANSIEYGTGKSYARMLDEWENAGLGDIDLCDRACDCSPNGDLI